MCTERAAGGAALLFRIDVPSTSKHAPFTRFFGIDAIYAIYPVTEQFARWYAEKIQLQNVIENSEFIEYEKRNSEAKLQRELKAQGVELKSEAAGIQNHTTSKPKGRPKKPPIKSNKLKEINQLISHEEAQRSLGVTRQFLYNQRRNGRLKAYKLGGKIRFHRDDLLALLKEG
jgi:excisionase family DNA binding protein